VTHEGTGNLRLNAQDAGKIVNLVDGSERLIISPGGAVGIGTETWISETWGDVFSMVVSAGNAEGHGPNCIIESSSWDGNFGFLVSNMNDTYNDTNKIGTEAYSHIHAASGAAVQYFRSDSTLNASRGNTGEQSRWIMGQLSNSGPNYDATGSAEGSLGRTLYIGHQWSNNSWTTSNNGRAWKFSDAGWFGPGADGVQDLGNSNHKFQDIYATNSTIQTSDRERKENIEDSSLGLNFINNLTPRSYKWKDYTTAEQVVQSDATLMGLSGSTTRIDTISTDHTVSRTHYGLIAQEVKDVLDSMGLDSSEFAGYIDPSVNGEGGNVGLRYSEFIAPLIKAVQELSAKVDEQRAVLAELTKAPSFKSFKDSLSGAKIVL